MKEITKTGISFDETQVLYGKLRPYLHNWLNPDFEGVAVGDWWVLKPVEMDKNYLRTDTPATTPTISTPYRFTIIQTQQKRHITKPSTP